MLPADRIERSLLIVALCLGIALISLRVSFPQLEFLDWPFADAYSNFATDSAPDTDAITLVLIDDDGLVRMGERWPLSRKTWGDFLRVVAAHEPAAVALDVWFETPSPKGAADLALDVADQLNELEFGESPQGMDMVAGLERMASVLDEDRLFASSLADLGKVVLGMVCADGRKDIDIGRNMLPRPLDVKLKDREGVLRCAKLAASIAPLAVASHSQAGLIVPHDRDGKIRRYPLVFEAGDDVYPSLALAAVMAGRRDQGEKILNRAAQMESSRPLLRFQEPDDFRILRFGDVMEADRNSPGLKKGISGKILIVGVSAQGTQDFVRTPNHTAIPGVFVHASAMAGLLGNGFMVSGTPWGSGVGLALVFILFWLLRNPQDGLRVFLKFAGVMTLWLGICVYAVNQSVLFPAGSVALALLIVAGGGYAVLFLRGQNARHRARAIRRAFAFYLSPTVVQELIADPTKLKLGGSRREITAFFSDVKGFTSISEQMNPADLVQLLNECLGSMTEIILEEGGTIDKYIGDAVVAMFGAPISHEDHALRACRAALRCQENLASLRKDWLARGWPEIEVRIGLNTGVAVVGNMGSQQRFDYTMMGDAVNKAARLEGVNKVYGTSILVSGETMSACALGVYGRELDSVLMKGKGEGVHIYEPLSLLGDETPEHRELSASFAAGLEAWRKRDWDSAKTIFERLARDGDSPSKEFLNRLKHLSLDDYPEGWDGVYVMRSK